MISFCTAITRWPKHFLMVNEMRLLVRTIFCPDVTYASFLFNVIPHFWLSILSSVTAAMLCKYSQYASPVKYNRLFGRKHRDATGGWTILSGGIYLSQLSCKLRITTLGDSLDRLGDPQND